MITNKGSKNSSTPSKKSKPAATAAKPAATAGMAMAKSDPGATTAPSHMEIAQKAYELWLATGQQPGCEQQNWLEAERQLRQR